MTDSAPAAEPLFRVEGAWLAYGRRVVLQDVSLDISPGQFWCFLGTNGSGKTTLIKALLGALPLRAGRIVRRSDFAQRNRLGYVPQMLELRRGLPISVAEFVLAGLCGLPSDAALRRSRLTQALDLVGLPHQGGRDLWSLSGGQRQRAMVARALVRDPRVLIVDEPLAGLDLRAARDAIALMRDLFGRFRTPVVFVTHDLQLAASLATHVALFRERRVAAGEAARLLTAAELGATFGVEFAVADSEAGRRIALAG